MIESLLALLGFPAVGLAAWAQTQREARRRAAAALDAPDPAEVERHSEPLVPEHVDPLLSLGELAALAARWPHIVSSYLREDHVR